MSARRRIVRIVLAVLLLILLAFAGITWIALESSDVAVVETRRADGGTRRTHVWWVEDDGTTWLEAGTPENGWFVDVGRDPELRFSAGGRSGSYRAEVVRDPDAHPRLRSRLREKYGWRDAWVSIYVNQSRSIAVRLVPLAAPGHAD